MNADVKQLMAEAFATVREKALVMNFIMATSRENFQPLFDKLENDYTLGENNYPSTRVAAYNVLINYKKGRSAVETAFDENLNVSFA